MANLKKFHFCPFLIKWSTQTHTDERTDTQLFLQIRYALKIYLTFIRATLPFVFEFFLWAFGLFLIALAALLTVFRGLRWNFSFEGSLAPTENISVSSEDWRGLARSLLSWKIFLNKLIWPVTKPNPILKSNCSSNLISLKAEFRIGMVNWLMNVWIGTQSTFKVHGYQGQAGLFNFNRAGLNRF